MKSWEYERDRLIYLKSTPLPKTDPYLLEKIRVKILKPFCVGGVMQTPEMGTILISRFDAVDLVSRGKVTIIQD